MRKLSTLLLLLALAGGVSTVSAQKPCWIPQCIWDCCCGGDETDDGRGYTNLGSGTINRDDHSVRDGHQVDGSGGAHIDQSRVTIVNIGTGHVETTRKDAHKVFEKLDSMDSGQKSGLFDALSAVKNGEIGIDSLGSILSSSGLADVAETALGTVITPVGAKAVRWGVSGAATVASLAWNYFHSGRGSGPSVKPSSADFLRSLDQQTQLAAKSEHVQEYRRQVGRR